MAAARGILVGGSWAQAASGETMEVLNPATEEVLAVVPRCGAEDVDAAVEAARSALPEWLDSTPGERSEMLLGLARVLEENADELAGIESANVGKPLAYAKDELSIMVDHMRFFAGAARVLEGKSTGEYSARLHVDDPAGAARGRRRDRALELPADDGGLEAGAGARGRERPGAEAVGADPAVAASLRGAGRGRAAAGRAERRHGRRRAGRRADRDASRRSARVAHRRRRDGEDDRTHGSGHAQARPSRARREGAGRRVRRRRSGRGRRGDQDRRVLELGAGLHRGVARASPGRGSTRRCSRSSCRRWSRSPSAIRRAGPRSTWGR